MLIDWFAIFLWVLAFVAFLAISVSLAMEWGVMGFFVCVAACGGLAFAGISYSQGQYRIAAACKSFVASGYAFSYCSDAHVKLLFGSGRCELEFEAQKRDGVYRPVIPAVHLNGKKYKKTVFPDFIKTCLA